MFIKKQRLLTPGPTPLYPPALHAMMRSDMHHRTEDFRKVGMHLSNAQTRYTESEKRLARFEEKLISAGGEAEQLPMPAETPSLPS